MNSPIIDLARTKIGQEISTDELFLYEGKHIKALAFLQGLKDSVVEKLKTLAKENGYKYNYDYDCYLKSNKGCHLNGAYRIEKDDFLHSIINWKLSNKVE